MIEIKFRGLTKKGKWVYGWYCEVLGYHYIIPNDADIAGVRPPNTYGILGFIEVIPETVGQSTGLKDKNGKEIYGGDKVLFTIFDHNAIDTQYTGNIHYNIQDAAWEIDIESKAFPLGETFMLGDILRQDEEFEIIGNVYQKKENSQKPKKTS